MADAKEPWYEANARRGREKRQAFLKAIGDGMNVAEATRHVGWKNKSAYAAARRAWPDFAAAVDVARADRHIPTVAAINHPIHAGEHHRPMDDGWDGTFAGFRRTYLNRVSPWFHVRAANLIENIVVNAYQKAGLSPHQPLPPGAELDFGGKVVLILWPPEHGKTAFWEDFDTYALSRWPWFRITVGSERSRHSEKVCEFVRSRLEHDAPGFARMRARFGPYAPPPGRARQSQPWNRTFFNVQKKPWAGERDNSMTALGMSGSVIGTRADLLQVDDPQSRKSLNRTPELVDVFTQDWLSRPGPTGLTVILMNRVGPDDFPQSLIDRGIVDDVIRVPVWDPDKGWAWPERYSHQHYLKMRRNVGEEAWERNYMQRGLAARSMSFRPDHIEPCKNPLRSVTHPPPKPEQGAAVVGIGVDPGYGTTAMTAGAHEPTKYRILNIVQQRELTRPEQMYLMLEDLLATYCVEGMSWVQYVTVETKAFQQGFITDDRFVELQRRYGFECIPYSTGKEKHDEDIGVPQMATSMLRHEFDFPDADDVSRRVMQPFYDECYRWRPGISGSKLRQDTVMSTWFDWLTWRRRRRSELANTSQFSFARAERTAS